MRKLGLVAAASILAMGVISPAMAQSYNWYQSPHDYDHDQLDQEHQDDHDYLGDVHRDAHEEGMTRREHRRLHRYMNREHAREHRQLGREHRWDHWDNRNPYYYGWSSPRYRYDPDYGY